MCRLILFRLPLLVIKSAQTIQLDNFGSSFNLLCRVWFSFNIKGFLEFTLIKHCCVLMVSLSYPLSFFFMVKSMGSFSLFRPTLLLRVGIIMLVLAWTLSSIPLPWTRVNDQNCYAIPRPVVAWLRFCSELVLYPCSCIWTVFRSIPEVCLLSFLRLCIASRASGRHLYRLHFFQGWGSQTREICRHVSYTGVHDCALIGVITAFAMPPINPRFSRDPVAGSRLLRVGLLLCSPVVLSKLWDFCGLWTYPDRLCRWGRGVG